MPATAKQLLQAVRRKYPTMALLTEITVVDPEVQGWANLTELQGVHGDYYRRVFEKNPGKYPIAESLPDDWMTNQDHRKYQRRIDGLLFDGGQSRTAIEVKISRADFRRDTEEKRRAWKSYTNRFVYLTPQGLLRAEEIPAGCGLWEVSEYGHITVTKKATINKTPLMLPDQVVVNLAYRLQKAEQGRR